jgi:polysaccharide biosynthesis transport protein
MDEQEIHLRDYFHVIRKRKYIVILFFVITVLGVLVSTVMMKPIYEATTQVLVEKNQSASLTQQPYYDVYDPEFYETQRQVILSQSVARKVVAILDLDKKWKDYFPEEEKKGAFLKKMKDKIKDGLKKILPGKNGAEQITSAIPQEKPTEADRIADQLRDSITISPVKDSHVMNISFKAKQPDFARLVANTLAAAYKEEVMAIQMNSSNYARKWMTKKSEEERTNLARSEKALQAYMKMNDIVTVEDKITILPQQLSQLTLKLSEAQAQKNSVANVYRQLQEVVAQKGDLESLSTITGNKEFQDIRVTIREAEQKLGQLGQELGAKHPAMIEAREKLNNAIRQKNDIVHKIVNSIKNDYSVAEAQEASIRDALADVKDETQSMNEKMMEYNILKREVDTNKTMYDALILQLKEKGATENTQKINVWTTEVAQTPEAPVKPKPLVNMLLAIVLGLFGGIGCAFFVEYLDNTVKDPEEAERRFGMTVIGVIELLRKGKNPDRYTSEEPASSFAESYKSLRTAVLLSSAERPPKRLMITSMSPQEGKTTTAMNLARSLVLTNRKVLLIDADLRRPRLHKAFQLDNSNGLSTYLSGAIQEIPVQSCDEPGLSVLTSGPVPPNPSELLGSARFGQLLAGLEPKFDTIIIDSPPILSATDSLLVTKHAEGVIVVCLAGKTTHDRLQKGLKSIKDINGNVIGLVLNAMDMKKNNYYAYYGYYKY